MKNRLSIFFLLIFVALYSCSKDNVNQEINKPPLNNNGTGELNENVYVFSEQHANSYLENFSENTIILKSYPYDLEEGDIINSGISDKTPNGFLKKIKSVRKDGDNTIIEVENATLEDALKEATVSVSKEANFNELVELFDEAGNLVEYKISEYTYDHARASLTLPRLDFPFYLRIDESSSISGTIGFSALIEANLKIKDGKIDEFGYCISPIISQSITLNTEVEGLSFRRRLITIPIDKFTAASGVTLVLRPSISIYFVCEAGKLSFEATIERDYTIKKGFFYSSANGWKIVNENDVFDLDPFNYSSKFGFEANFYSGLSMVAAISIFDESLFSVGVEAGLGLTFKFTAELNPEDLLRLDQPTYGLYFTPSFGPYISKIDLTKSFPEYKNVLDDFVFSYDFKIMEYDAFPKFEEKEVIREGSTVSVTYTLERVPRFLFNKIGTIILNDGGDLINKIEYDEVVSILTELGKEYKFQFEDLDKNENYHIYTYVSLFDKPYYMKHTSLDGEKDDEEDDDDGDDDDDDEKPIDPIDPLHPGAEFFVGTWEYYTIEFRAAPFLVNTKILLTFKKDGTFYYTFPGAQNYQWRGTWNYSENEYYPTSVIRFECDVIYRENGSSSMSGPMMFWFGPIRDENILEEGWMTNYGTIKRVNTPHPDYGLPYPDYFKRKEGDYTVYYDLKPDGSWASSIGIKD